MSANCTNCFSAAQKCNQVKEELKTSKNAVKKMEKQIAETEKEVAASRQTVQKLKEQRQARLSIKEQLDEMQKEMAKLMKENEEQELLNQELTAEHAKISATKPMSKEERRNVIFDLKDKIWELQGSKIYQKTMYKTMFLEMSEDWQMKKLAATEEIRFQKKYEAYEKALEESLKIVQGNSTISRSEVPVLPVYPSVSQKFEEEFKKAKEAKEVEAKNKELDEECIICQDPMDKSMEHTLFECPGCRNIFHATCIDEWFLTSKTCPCCRATWK